MEETLNHGDVCSAFRDDAQLKNGQQYEVDVTLNPDTAPPQLIMSENTKQETWWMPKEESPREP